jgi:hypothetical protein
LKFSRVMSLIRPGAENPKIMLLGPGQAPEIQPDGFRNSHTYAYRAAEYNLFNHAHNGGSDLSISHRHDRQTDHTVTIGRFLSYFRLQFYGVLFGLFTPLFICLAIWGIQCIATTWDFGSFSFGNSLHISAYTYIFLLFDVITGIFEQIHTATIPLDRDGLGRKE